MLAGILSPVGASTRAVLIPDPRLYSFEEWAVEVCRQLPDLPLPASDWRRWADALFKSRRGSFMATPSHESYEDWKEWALRAYQVLM